MGPGDNLGAILSGLVVIPAICALSNTGSGSRAIDQGNFGLTFIYIYQLFTTIPGGRFISFIFFGLLAIAAITSLFSMIEVGVKCVVDMGVGRKKAVVGVCFAGFVAGCFSAWSLNNIDNQDWVWGIGASRQRSFYSNSCNQVWRREDKSRRSQCEGSRDSLTEMVL